jgi:hypothetical protein
VEVGGGVVEVEVGVEEVEELEEPPDPKTGGPGMT